MEEKEEKVTGEEVPDTDFLRHFADATSEITEIKCGAAAWCLFGFLASDIREGKKTSYAFMPSPLIEGKDKENFMAFAQWTKAIDIREMLSMGYSEVCDPLSKYSDQELTAALSNELRWMYVHFVENIRKANAAGVNAPDGKDQ